MKTDKKTAQSIRRALGIWQAEGLLDQDKSSLLSSSIEVLPFDWKRLAKYLMVIALICLISAVAFALADDTLIALLKQIFNATDSTRAIVFGILSVLIFLIGRHFRIQSPARRFTLEGILASGALTSAVVIYELGIVFDSGNHHFSLLFLAGFALYFSLGLAFRSKLLWTLGLLALGVWYSGETGYASHWDGYFLGMNYALRFLPFSALLLAANTASSRTHLFAVRYAVFYDVTLRIGLLYLFGSLLTLSVVGNIPDEAAYQSLRQVELLPWNLLCAAVSAIAIYLGLRMHEQVISRFGVTFFMLNLYAVYFGYLWNSIHRALFFAGLALSLWALGSWIEKKKLR